MPVQSRDWHKSWYEVANEAAKKTKKKNNAI